MMKESSKWIAAFVEIIIENGDWTETDRYYLTNRIAKLVGCDFFEQPEAVACEQEPLRVVEHLLNIAQPNHQIDDSITEAEQLEAELMDFITPTQPSLIGSLWIIIKSLHEKQRIIFISYVKRITTLKRKQSPKILFSQWTHPMVN